MPEPATVFTRRNIWSLSPSDPIVTGYATAVKAMRARPQNNQTSWTYQAAIHGTRVRPELHGWNQCQHETWFFLPWHRMFLYYFERMARAAVVAAGGPADWALPYWNYGLGGQNAELPLAFRQPKLADGSENPLYAERATGMNSGTGAIKRSAGSPDKALERPSFIGRAEFGGDRTAPAQFAEHAGVLEITPHGSVHDAVGMGGWPMSDVLRAAQDPIFWLHHANIDRIWSEWIATSGAHHANPTDAAWLSQSFSFFDEHGQPASMHCGQVLETIADLGYTYDGEPSQPHPPAAPAPRVRAGATPDAVSPQEPEMIGATERSVVLTGHQVTVPVPIDQQAAHPLGASVRAYLNVEEIDGETNPGTGYEVYVNIDSHRPLDDQASHYLGNLSFFGIEMARNPAGEQGPHAKHASFEITPIARELDARGEWAGHALLVTFEPLGLELAQGAAADAAVESPVHEEQPVRLGRLSVFYDA